MTPPPPPEGRGNPRRKARDDSDSDSDSVGYADPVQDDLYLRKVGVSLNVSELYDKFLPKFWTPEEDHHVQGVRVGSRRRPWYRKIQGFRSVLTGGLGWGQGAYPPFPKI